MKSKILLGSFEIPNAFVYVDKLIDWYQYDKQFNPPTHSYHQ